MIPILVIAIIVIIYNVGWISNILIHGNIAGPCVWVSDYMSFGGTMDELTYDKNNDCYVK